MPWGTKRQQQQGASRTSAIFPCQCSAIDVRLFAPHCCSALLQQTAKEMVAPETCIASSTTATARRRPRPEVTLPVCPVPRATRARTLRYAPTSSERYLSHNVSCDHETSSQGCCGHGRGINAAGHAFREGLHLQGALDNIDIDNETSLRWPLAASHINRVIK